MANKSSRFPRSTLRFRKQRHRLNKVTIKSYKKGGELGTRYSTIYGFQSPLQLLNKQFHQGKSNQPVNMFSSVYTVNTTNRSPELSYHLVDEWLASIAYNGVSDKSAVNPLYMRTTKVENTS